MSVHAQWEEIETGHWALVQRGERVAACKRQGSGWTWGVRAHLGPLGMVPEASGVAKSLDHAMAAVGKVRRGKAS